MSTASVPESNARVEAKVKAAARGDGSESPSGRSLSARLEALAAYLPLALQLGMLVLVFLMIAFQCRPVDTSQAELLRQLLAAAGKGPAGPEPSKPAPDPNAPPLVVPAVEPTKENLSAFSVALNQFKTDVDDLKSIKAALDKQNEELKNVLAARTAEATGQVIEQKVVKSVSNIQNMLSDLALATNGMAGQLRRETEKRDTAIVLFRSRNLIDPGVYLHQAGEELCSRPYGDSYPNARFGVYVASGDQIVASVIRLEKWAQPGEPKISPEQFSLALPANANPETPGDLRADEQIFKTAPAPPNARRGCLLLLSSQCKAPDGPNDPYKGLAVDVLWIDEVRGQRPPADEKECLLRLEGWQSFCQNHAGGVCLPFRTTEMVKPEDQKKNAEAFRSLLRLLINPYR